MQTVSVHTCTHTLAPPTRLQLLARTPTSTHTYTHTPALTLSPLPLLDAHWCAQFAARHRACLRWRACTVRCRCWTTTCTACGSTRIGGFSSAWPTQRRARC